MPYCVIETSVTVGRESCRIMADAATKAFLFDANIGNVKEAKVCFKKRIEGDLPRNSFFDSDYQLCIPALEAVNDFEKHGWKVVNMQRSEAVSTSYDPTKPTDSTYWSWLYKPAPTVPFTRYTWTLHKEL